MSCERLGRSYQGGAGPSPSWGSSLRWWKPASLPVSAPVGSLSSQNRSARTGTKAWSVALSGSGPAVNLGSSPLLPGATSALTNPWLSGNALSPVQQLQAHRDPGQKSQRQDPPPQGTSLYMRSYGVLTEVCKEKTDRCKQVSDTRPLVGIHV